MITKITLHEGEVNQALREYVEKHNGFTKSKRFIADRTVDSFTFTIDLESDGHSDVVSKKDSNKKEKVGTAPKAKKDEKAN